MFCLFLPCISTQLLLEFEVGAVPTMTTAYLLITPTAVKNARYSVINRIVSQIVCHSVC